MATSTAEVVYLPENIDGKAYMGYQRFRLRVWVCSGISMLIVLSVAVALIVQVLNFSTFLSQRYELAEGDMRKISVSTAFCEEVSLGKDTSKRNLWILPSLRLRHQLRHTNTSTEVFVSKFHYWYKGFYLLEGSSIVINAESDNALALFIFKDKKRLNEWIDQNGDPQKTAASGHYEEAIPTSQPTKISYTLSALETGNYYILFKYSKEGKDFARMKLDLNINRKVYDLESSVYSCSAGSQDTCSAKLLFGSSEVGVLEVTDESMESAYRSNELITTWRCVPRIWFYLAVFAGPILFAAVASFVFYFVFISRKKEKHLQRLAVRRQQCLRRASGAGHSNSFSNRSLNGSIRRPPSRTPSARSLGNQTDMSRVPFLQPVVTTMYTGNSLSASEAEDSGNDTDEEHKQNNVAWAQHRKASVDNMSLASREVTVSREPSFTTFQGSGDEAANVETIASRNRPETTGSRNPSGRLRDNANQTNERTISDRQKMREKFRTGTVPKNPPTRRYSSDELYDRGSRTLPQHRGYLAPGVQGPYQHAPGVETVASRNSSERLHDGHHGRRSFSERAHKHRYDGHEVHDKIPNGTVPRNSPTRRYSSDELYDRELYERVSKTLPINRINTDPIAHPPYQLTTDGKAAWSRNSNERLRDTYDGEKSIGQKTRKPSSEGRSRSHHDIGGKIPNGTIPNSPTRRYSSEKLYDREMCDHTSKTLPRNRGYTASAASPGSDQLALERYLLPIRPSPLPSLPDSERSRGLPLPSAPDSRPGVDIGADGDNDFHNEPFAEPHKIKLRTHSGRRREMGWSPRLSMVSESEV